MSTIFNFTADQINLEAVVMLQNLQEVERDKDLMFWNKDVLLREKLARQMGQFLNPLDLSVYPSGKGPMERVFKRGGKT